MSDAKAEHVRWDLNSLYRGVEDPQIDADVSALITGMKVFSKAYKGKLRTHLSDAITSLSNISMLQEKVGLFLGLKFSLNTGDGAVKAKSAEVQRKLAEAGGAYMEFFNIELAALSEESIAKQMKDPVVTKHKPFIDHVRIYKPHMLTEPVESALTKRSPFGAGAWGDFFDELEADLEFEFKGKTHTITEILHVISESQDTDERAEAMHIVNKGLKGQFAKYAAETLYMVAGSKGVEGSERGYSHPMQSRNMSNRTPDQVVDALHKAVIHTAAPLAQRFYKLKATHLGMKTLRWSDRNAPMPFEDNTIVPYDEAMQMVLAAYESFSPTLAKLIEETLTKKHIDAPAQKGKRGGAFNASGVLPGNTPVAYTFLNYLGSNRDVMTLAHELGHGVHGLLGGAAQGPLMGSAPIAFAETASVFGEGLTTRFLRERLIEHGDKKALLGLIMDKLDDIINTTVRQISFSCFEQQVHGRDATYSKWSEPKKHSVEELVALWKRVTAEFYGPEGTIFTYTDTDYLWAYISHFHNPFYVYGYAFGQFFTDSIIAVRSSFAPEEFEKLYLDLLRAGSTKNATELIAPFGLNPADESFWNNGIKAGLGALVEEAEKLSEAIR